MAQATFKTNPIHLEELLRDCEKGIVQLPDFQRSWVWDDDRIRSLIASISRAFPVGALMTLDTGGPVKFKPRPIEGAPPEASTETPHQLLLDGQQRMTSLYQTCVRRYVVETINAQRKAVKRWYYLDMQASLDPSQDREGAIIGVPEDRIVRTNFGKDVVLDLSSPEREYEQLMFPVNRVFDWDEWQDNFGDYWIDRGQAEKRNLFKTFKNEVLQNFKSYQVPVITLVRETIREAVCLVFEKVNTGGKPLDAFELLTAMYASQGFELRKDWLGEGAESGRHTRLRTFGHAAGQEHGVLDKVASTDFLQAISLLHTKERRRSEAATGVEGRDLPAVSAARQSLLNLPLDAYQKYADRVEEGFKNAAKFLRLQKIYRVTDLPYQSQLVPLTAILTEIGDRWEHQANRKKIARWYWSGVFGELYGSTIESRFAKDIVEVPEWLDGRALPTTVDEAVFRADRLLSMRSRLSAAYKGVNALLMQEGARDFRTGQEFDQTVFFDETVDIHHVFPRDWCKTKKIDSKTYDSIINKTPLSSRTNRILGGVAPSKYLHRLQKGGKGALRIEHADLDRYVASHLIDPTLLRNDQFEAFFEQRQRSLLKLIEQATGQAAYSGHETNEPEADAPGGEGEEEAVLAAE